MQWQLDRHLHDAEADLILFTPSVRKLSLIVVKEIGCEF